MTRVCKHIRKPLALAVAAVVGAWQPMALAQEEGDPSSQVTEEEIEEVVVLGRAISATQELINERLTDASVIDTLGADTISRLGDSTVGAVLRRLPGLTLVNDKFVFIRGLGERYSSSQLNGANIPSPDLTRNVIPLDIFPTAIVESLRVQKAWAAHLPANFAGGNVDIRTRGIPDGFIFQAELGTGYNDLNSDDGLSYPGGGDDSIGTDDGTRALSSDLRNAIGQFQGQLDVEQMFTFLSRQDSTATRADAQALNRQLATQLNRGSRANAKDIPLDLDAKLTVGNNWLIGDDWEFGALIGGSYDQEWRQQTAFAREAQFPDQRIDTERETTHSVNLSGTGTFGLKFLEDHEIQTTTLWLRNTDDETAIRDFFNANREVQDGQGFRNYRFQFEERELVTNQIRGSHYLGIDTRERFPLIGSLVGWLPEQTRIDWFYSDSRSETDIPNQVDIRSSTVTDRETAEVQSERVNLSNDAATHRFIDLNDEVEDYGWSLNLPLEFGRNYVELSGGTRHSEKIRTYEQLAFNLGPLTVEDDALLSGSLDEVFSDQAITDPANNYVFSRLGSGLESYIAATMTDSVFGSVDWTFNDTWRVAAGARYEDYRQVALEWDPFGFSLDNPQIDLCAIINPCDPLVDGFDDSDFEAQVGFQDDQIFPAVSLTYMGELWADTFQLRFGWSETAVRPDLRELTNVTYIDPITDAIVEGDPDLVPADVTNFDIRAEWYFGGGDNFSITAFYKDIDNPIEFFASGRVESGSAREIINAESAEVQGVEVEFLKELGFLGSYFDSFFLQANATIQDTELVAGPNADAPTNPVRPLAGASDWITNVVLGYDSPNAMHTATLVFNTYGERLFQAGRLGAEDSFEQPFNSLDLTYSWYPTDQITVKFKAVNLLGDSLEIDRAGVTIFDEDPGTTFSASFLYFIF